MRRILLVLIALSHAAAAGAAALALPVHYPGDAVRPPCYQGDVLEVQLAPAAARLAHPLAAGPVRAQRTARLGVAALDLAAADLRASFEPEFAGESPSESGADFTAFHLVHLGAGVRLEDALARFESLPEVASVSPVTLTHTAAFPNDSLFARQHWLYRAGAPRHDVHAPEAWDVFAGDTSIVVAVLDTGVLPYHPDLGGTVAGRRGNLYTNWAEAGGAPGVDDDGDGFADDVSGWDFVTGVSGDPSDDLDVADNDPNDEAGHGTIVAGLVGAIGNNTSGVAGIVPNVRILPVRVAWLDVSDTRPNGTVSMVFAAQGIRFATRAGASVINCSFATAATAGLDSAVSAATRAGVTVVSASGNGGSPTYLATRADVVSVAAVDSTDAFWGFSGLGPTVDLSADGEAMASTYFAPSTTGPSGPRTPSYLVDANLTGTSFAAPQVAGAVALMQGQRRAQGRDPLTPLGALLRLRDTAADIAAANGNTPGYPPRLDLLRALADPPRSLSVRASGVSVRAPLVLAYNTGATRVIVATSNRRLTAYDGATGDTAWTVAIPVTGALGTPLGWMAGADMGAGVGAAFFVGTNQGAVLGYRDDGTVLPNWPKRLLGTGAAMSGGVALADVDGDGQPDVVCGQDDGTLWAWHADGTALAGFPVSGLTGPLSAPALEPLDANAGAEIVVTDGAGAVHALTASGNELWSWPGPAGALAPLVMRAGHVGGPLVLVASPGSLTALDATGAEAWTRALPGAVPVEPALGDFDGDGADDIAIASGAPVSVALRDSAGLPLARAGWPFTPAAPPIGPLVAGPLAPGGGIGLGFWSTNGFVAFDSHAVPLAAFPKAVTSAGQYAFLADLDGDGATEVAAGSAADSSLCTFDAGDGTWNAALASWATPRGDAARTASRARPGMPVRIDRIRPAAVGDLAAAPRSTTSLAVTWSVTGDDSLAGRAAAVELRMDVAPLTPATFASGTLLATAVPGGPGTPDSALATGLQEGHTYWFALRVRDAAGNVSALSNAASATTAGLAPAAIADLRVTALADTVATLAWTATGDDGTTGRPLSYTIAAAPAPFDSLGFDTAPLHVTVPASVDAGGAEGATMPGLLRGHRWYFMVRALDHAATISASSNTAVVVVPIGGALRGRIGVAVAAREGPAHVPATIDWQGADDAAGRPQRLTLHDLAGRELRRVDVGAEPGGSWVWDGRDGEGRAVRAGLYFVRLESGSRAATARVVLVR